MPSAVRTRLISASARRNRRKAILTLALIAGLVLMIVGVAWLALALPRSARAVPSKPAERRNLTSHSLVADAREGYTHGSVISSTDGVRAKQFTPLTPPRGTPFSLPTQGRTTLVTTDRELLVSQARIGTSEERSISPGRGIVPPAANPRTRAGLSALSVDHEGIGLVFQSLAAGTSWTTM